MVSVQFWSGLDDLHTGSELSLDRQQEYAQRGPVLVLANHESYLDPLAVGLAVRRPLSYLAKKSLFTHPTFGAYLRSVRCIPVDQEGVAKEGLKTSIEVLQKDKALLIFPEGSRSIDGNMVPFKPGISLILKRVPVPIVPVGVAGAFEAYPMTAPMPKISPMFWPSTAPPSPPRWDRSFRPSATKKWTARNCYASSLMPLPNRSRAPRNSNARADRRGPWSHERPARGDEGSPNTTFSWRILPGCRCRQIDFPLH